MARLILTHPIFLILVIQPLLAVGLILFLRRFPATRKLSPILLIVGVIGALLTAIFTFLRSTVPIAPYELGPGAWLPNIYYALWSLYIGFGLGVLGAAIIGLPISFLTSPKK